MVTPIRNRRNSKRSEFTIFLILKPANKQKIIDFEPAGCNGCAMVSELQEIIHI